MRNVAAEVDAPVPPIAWGAIGRSQILRAEKAFRKRCEGRTPTQRILDRQKPLRVLTYVTPGAWHLRGLCILRSGYKERANLPS